MRRSGGLFGALFLVAAAIVPTPGRAEDIPFVRTVIAPDSPHGPCGNALGDLDGDGRLERSSPAATGHESFSEPAFLEHLLVDPVRSR